jgi:two-component system OmpR family sensor kinase
VRGRFGRSARTRILASYAILVLASSAAAVVIIRSALLERAADRVGEALAQETSEFRLLSSSHPHGASGHPQTALELFDSYFMHSAAGEGETVLTYVDGELYRTRTGLRGATTALADRLERVASQSRPTEGEIDTASGLVRYRSEPVRRDGRLRGALVVASDLGAERAEVEDAVVVVAIVLGGMCLLASAAAWLIAGRVLAPLRELSETAQAITETDLSRRIEVHGNDEIAELARTFNAMLDRIGEAFSAQRDFVSDASHELRTPITIVRGHLELMGEDPRERSETVALVTDELDRMARIVNDLLVLARAERPDFLRLGPVELDGLTRELLVKAAGIAPRKWSLEAAQTGTVAADQQRLTQAMINLLHNAAEHTGEDDEIGLGSVIADGCARLWVRDTGPGIAPADRKRIFERFSRLSDGPRRTEGAGLGLAIADAIARAHGGRIELETAEGAGSTFTLVIPVERREPGGAA